MKEMLLLVGVGDPFLCFHLHSKLTEMLRERMRDGEVVGLAVRATNSCGMRIVVQVLLSRAQRRLCQDPKRNPTFNIRR